MVYGTTSHNVAVGNVLLSKKTKKDRHNFITMIQ